MAFFEFLPAAAGARIVAPDFGTVALDRARRSIASALVGSNELLPPLLTLDLFFTFFLLDGLKQEEECQSIFFNAIHQSFEQLVRLFLVFNQRIALAVAAKTDTFLQVVHRQEVIFPVRVYDL